MHKILTVAVREFLETVKTKTFFISSVLIPGLIIALVLGSQRIAELAEREEVPTRQIAVVDQTDVVFDGLARKVAEHNQKTPQRKFALERVEGEAALTESLRERVRRGEVYAYLVIPRETIAGDVPCEFGRKDSRLQVQLDLQRMVNDAVIGARFERADPPVDLERIRKLQANVDFRDVDVKTGQETTGTELTRFMTPFAFMFLLFMGTMTISQGLLTSVIEEKSSRVVEVLLSAVSPTQLMGGKILGMVAVGAVLLVIWGTVGYGAARVRDMSYLVTPHHLTYLVLYFIPGFLLMSAFLAGVGAACNSIKEAQSMAAPLTILTIVPMMLWWAITQNPTSALSIVLSYIPPITPFVMILRICADPETPLVEVITTLLLLWLSVLAMIWAAGKIFRVGVLMYGKPPSPRELIRWLRYA
jgi:ABC-2 type transport system permease protein